MKRYLIERDIPNVGSLTAAQLRDLAATSNNALAKLSGKVQWVQSFIAAEVPTIIGPMTAYERVQLTEAA